MLDHRVVTLHPKIHGGILADRRKESHRLDLERHGIAPFDLVVVNLYPFDEVAWRKGVREEEAVEMIDIGGPAMLRAAAKNFMQVAPVCSPAQYEPVLAELRETGEISLATRRSLAATAFAHTAAYEASIMRWFAGREPFPEQVVIALRKELDLAYGENPHQRAAYYSEVGAARPSALERRAGLRARAVVQQPERPRRCPRDCSRSSRCPPA